MLEGFDTINQRSKILQHIYDVFQSLRMVFISASSADPGEMPHPVAFHLGLQCMPKYLFKCGQCTEG